MKRGSLLFVLALVCIPLLVTATRATVQSQQEPNYLVISVFHLAPGRSFNDASAEVAEQVRIIRASGKYKSVRLFAHNWGSELAFYVISEPNDWASIPAGFRAILQAQPDFLDRPFRWQAHSDNILTEIPVD